MIRYGLLLVCSLLVVLARVQGLVAASIQSPENGRGSIKTALEEQGDVISGGKLGSERTGGRGLKNQGQDEEAAKKTKQTEEEGAAAVAAAEQAASSKKKKEEEEAAAAAAKAKAAEEAAAKKKKEEEAAAAEEAAKKKKQQEEAQKEEEMNFEHILNTKIIPELKARCSTFPAWTSSQVERCISFAEDGIEYDPLIFDLDDTDFDFDYRRSITGDAHAGGLPSLSQVSVVIAAAVLFFKYLPKM